MKNKGQNGSLTCRAMNCMHKCHFCGQWFEPFEVAAGSISGYCKPCRAWRSQHHNQLRAMGLKVSR